MFFKRFDIKEKGLSVENKNIFGVKSVYFKRYYFFNYGKLFIDFCYELDIGLSVRDIKWIRYSYWVYCL